MLRKASDLFGYTIGATDDEIGKVHDFYFDADEWTIRYMVADVGSWLFGRRVLIAPDALGTPNWDAEVFPVNLSREQVKESPDINLAAPVTRAQEANLYGYYGWPTYWGRPLMAGAPAVALSPVPSLGGYGAAAMPDEVSEAMVNAGESHVYSMRDVTGYSIEATDHSIGHVADFFADDGDWRIHYMLVDTGNWWPGKQVLVSPAWVESVDWGGSKVYVNVSKEQVKHSPEYDPNAPLDRQYEGRLHEHYGYPRSW